jgi:hypothetical protein
MAMLNYQRQTGEVDEYNMPHVCLRWACPSAVPAFRPSRPAGTMTTQP